MFRKIKFIKNHLIKTNNFKNRRMEYVVGGVIGGYCSLSIFFYFFPSLIHKKKFHWFDAFHISHRGGSGEATENTLAAFRHAMKVGTDMLELDVQLTKDGHVVVCHDSDLTNLCELPAVVANTNFEDLPLYKQVLPVSFAQENVVRVDSKIDRKIPELEEVFKEFVNVPINIDIKVDNDELIEKVAELILKYKREHITVWGSYSEVVNQKLYKKNSKISLFASLKRVALILLLFYTGLLPFVPLKESYFELPMIDICTKKIKALGNSKLKRFLMSFLDFILVNRLLFFHLRKRGIRLYVWVLNEPRDYECSLVYSPDGIMTDYPTKLRNFMDERQISKSGFTKLNRRPEDDGEVNDADVLVQKSETKVSQLVDNLFKDFIGSPGNSKDQLVPRTKIMTLDDIALEEKDRNDPNLDDYDLPTKQTHSNPNFSKPEVSARNLVDVEEFFQSDSTKSKLVDQ